MTYRQALQVICTLIADGLKGLKAVRFGDLGLRFEGEGLGLTMHAATLAEKPFFPVRILITLISASKFVYIGAPQNLTPCACFSKSQAT